jgi:hypothetical protein
MMVSRSLKILIVAAGLVVSAFLIKPALAQHDYEQLLSYLFFEDEAAYLDPSAFFCKLISLNDPEDTCSASFRIVDETSCKIEVVREFRATWPDKKGREYMRAKEIFTVGNLDLKRTVPQFDAQRQTQRATFQSDIDIYRHEGLQFSIDLDENGKYKSCRIDDQSVAIPESECAHRGEKPPTASKSMSLLFTASGFDRAIFAVKELQALHCPLGGDKT